MKSGHDEYWRTRLGLVVLRHGPGEPQSSTVWLLLCSNLPGDYVTSWNKYNWGRKSSNCGTAPCTNAHTPWTFPHFMLQPGTEMMDLTGVFTICFVKYTQHLNFALWQTFIGICWCISIHPAGSILISGAWYFCLFFLAKLPILFGKIA